MAVDETKNQEQIIYQSDINVDEGQFSRQAPDKYTNIVLREAIIGNPSTAYVNVIGIDYTDVEGAINETTNKCCLIWSNKDGGVLNPGGSGGKTTEETSYLPDDRMVAKNNDTSQMVGITSPFFWGTGDNWCGVRWMPPLGAKCIVGFGEHHRVYILGYITPSQRATKPILTPGEIVIKGYGKNYIHFRQSNKLDIVTGADEGDQDFDDTYGSMSCTATNRCEICLNSDKGYISLMVNGSGIKISSDGITVSAGGEANMTIGKGNIDMIASNSISQNSAQTGSGSGSNRNNG